jgi:hypothetical protein
VQRARQAAAVATEEDPVATAEELTLHYAYVRRDLTRIVIFAVFIFGMIFAARYLLPY